MKPDKFIERMDNDTVSESSEHSNMYPPLRTRKDIVRYVIEQTAQYMSYTGEGRCFCSHCEQLRNRASELIDLCKKM